MARTLALWLAFWLPVQAQTDPAVLQIRVIEGEGAVYATGSRATRGVTVRVTDETGKPVEGAAVTFRLPDDGPTGAFGSGERVEIIATGADGTALVWGMQWNRTPGPFEVRITAAKGQASAGTVCPLYLSDALVPATTQESPPPSSGGHKKLWIALALVGAAVAGVAAASGGAATGAAASTAGGPRIGSPTITIGKP